MRALIHRPSLPLRSLLALAAVLGLSASSVDARPRPTASATPVERRPARLPGYLGDERLPDAAAIVTAPPQPGSASDALDRSIFVETRGLQGRPRWTLAISDAEQSPAAGLADFDCALGLKLDAGDAPRLLHLLTRVGADAGHAIEQAKAVYKRPRPFLRDAGPICTARTDGLARSYSYPSGHSTVGWAYGLILAQLAPERATAVLARARAFGESRVVCGVHYASDVEAGRTLGASLVAVEHANPVFRTDLAAAKAELAHLRSTASIPPPSSCALQEDAAAHRPWPLASPPPP